MRVSTKDVYTASRLRSKKEMSHTKCPLPVASHTVSKSAARIRALCWTQCLGWTNFVSRQELTAGMAGQFSAQESSLVFDLADSNGDGEGKVNRNPTKNASLIFPLSLFR